MTEVRAFSCSICGAVSTEICVYCTKDTCPNHLCSKCLRCSDCCECDVPLEATGHPVAAEPEPVSGGHDAPGRIEG